MRFYSTLAWILFKTRKQLVFSIALLQESLPEYPGFIVLLLIRMKRYAQNKMSRRQKFIRV